MIPIHYVERSQNRKLGPIPATTLGRQGCPLSCALYDEGCYGLGGPQALHWSKVSRGERDHGIDAVCKRIRAQPANEVWRHAVTGDVTYTARGDIHRTFVEKLTHANQGRPVIAFTHADPTVGDNLQILHKAAANGFNFNLSANSPKHADELYGLRLPVVTVLPSDAPKQLQTPAGREIRTCPATYMEDKSCKDCGLCARSNRDVIVGFPAHGSQWKKVDLMVRAA